MSSFSDSSRLADACAEAVVRIQSLYPHTVAQLDAIRSAMAVMTADFSSLTLGDGPPQGGAVGWDGTPLNVSVRLRDVPSPLEVRWDMKVTPDINARTADTKDCWRRGIRIAERLEKELGVDLAAFRTLERIFRPDDETLRQITFAGSVSSNGASKFQSYFPWIDDIALGHRQIAAAASAFGVSEFAERLVSTASHDAVWMAADLAKDSRTKFYVTLRSYDSAHMDSFRSLAGELWPLNTDASHLMQIVYGEQPLRIPQGATGPTFCFHLRGSALSAVALDVSTSPFEVDLRDDRIQSEADLESRTSHLLSEFGIDNNPLKLAVREFATQELEREVSILQRLGILRDATGRAVTAYMNPRFFVHKYGYQYLNP